MTNATGTPLKVLETGPALRYVIASADGFPLAMTYGQQGQDRDARLFAAAPDLLAALEASPQLDCHHKYHNTACWPCMARAAIAKAKGV